MENFMSKYLPLILLGVIVVISLSTLFKIPKNLSKAMDKLEQAEKKIESTLKILNSQEVFLDSLIKINESVLIELDTIKGRNAEMSESINEKLKTAKSYLWTIRKNIKDLPDVIHKPR